MNRLQYAFCFLLLLARNTAQAQVIWGAGSSNPTADSIGTFACPFGTPNGWTSVATFPNNALWTRTTTGISQGAYSTGVPAFSSPSVSNGAALFDSDFWDNGGIPGNYGGGIAPCPHKSQLYSPFFDLTGYTNALLDLRLYLQYHNYSITELSVGFSADGGNTWNDFNLQQSGIGTNDLFSTAPVRISLIGAVLGVNDLDSCQLRLTFDGEYYFAMIDDIAIIPGVVYDITFADVMPMAPSAPFTAMPYYVAEAYSPYIYAATITNKGPDTIPATAYPTLHYSISQDIGMGGYVTLFTGADTLPEIAPMAVLDISGDITTELQNTIAANGAGSYRLTYWLTHNLGNDDTSNDTLVWDWKITGNQYAHVPLDFDGVPAANNYAYPNAEPGNVTQVFEWGSLFYFPDTMEILLDSVLYSMYVPAALNPNLTPFVVVEVKISELDTNSITLATALILHTTTIDTIFIDNSMLGTFIQRKVPIINPFSPTNCRLPFPLFYSSSSDPIYSISISQTNVNGIVGTNGEQNGLYVACVQMPYEWYPNTITLTPLLVVEGVAGIMGPETWFGGFAGDYRSPSISLKTFVGWWNPCSSTPSLPHTLPLLSLYPNPATDLLHCFLSVSVPNTHVTYIITDLQGRVLSMEHRQQNPDESYTLDVSQLPTGEYFMHARIQQQTISKPFTKL